MNCLYCGHPASNHPEVYDPTAPYAGCSECECRATSLGATTERWTLNAAGYIDATCRCNGDPAHPWHEHPIPD